MVGACGMGVGPLGIFLAQMGHEVYGYDDYPVQHVVRRLRENGIIMLDHLHGKRDFDEVIVSRAIIHTPERLQRFKERYVGAEILFRGEYLGRISKQFRTVAIAGSHGKTTTTANLIALLTQENVRFSHVLGGFFEKDTLPAAHFSGLGDWLVVEVDESDGTIEAFSPEISAITNVELDHVDQYPTEEAMRQVFLRLIDRTGQLTWVGHRAAEILRLRDGKQPDPRVRILQPTQSGDFVLENRTCAQSICACITGNGMRVDTFDFPSVERRQECLQLDERQRVVSDYAHHPGEIRALQGWAERQFTGAEIHWVFQPHRYTRTVALKKEFVEALAPLHPILLPEYGAFEQVIEAGTSASLHLEMQKMGSDCRYCQSPAEMLQALQVKDDGKHVFLFAGAGDLLLWKDWFVQSKRMGLARHYGDTDVDALWLSFHQERMMADGSYVACHEPLRRKTTMNVGGAARFYAEPASLESLQLVLKTSKMLKLPVRVLGNGSNLLVSDAGVDGVVIRLSKPFWKQCEMLGDGGLWVGAGLSLKRLCRQALEAGIGGFNFLDGIPGSVGGAVCMNAGAMGTELAERVVEAECLDLSGKRIRLSRDEMGFSYRHCEATETLMVLHVLLAGDPDEDREQLTETLELYRARRHASQPADPSAGCMFKNPEGESAGRLIDAAGLKGFAIGGASVSRKHGNFLITAKNTRSEDVEAVMRHVKTVVRGQFGIDLQQEIQMFPENRMLTDS